MRYPSSFVGLLSILITPLGLLAITPHAAHAQAAPKIGGAASAGNLTAVPGLVREAMQIAAGITDARATATALTEIGAARAQAGNLAGAKQSFAEARRSAAAIAAPDASAGLLKATAAAQAAAGDRAGAHETFAAASRAAAQIADPDKNFDLVSVNILVSS